jgi:hypothetical protein
MCVQLKLILKLFADFSTGRINNKLNEIVDSKNVSLTQRVQGIES